jgi:hypothetical protein
MNPISASDRSGLSAGDRVGDYQVRRVEALPEIHAVFHELVHPATGARHIHIRRPDAENTFGVLFKTVPRDSTGVAHILEHVVLCGSERFPVRDPFFSMLKRSLSTFMNAFTSSDWTMYPFSTQNRKDFYNLMDVYLDAAFFPRLEELSFKQEGHRLELDPSDGGERPVFKGVVYNEMKGAMSSPDQVMARSILKALYPDTTYAFNSGGDPREIPELTYAQLREFHRRHYHPSNACFFSYGDLPLEAHLEVVARSVLSRFTAIDPATDVPCQPRWPAPREFRFPYPFSRTEDPARRCQACVGWLTSDIRDTGAVLSLSLLEQVLLGNAASPLRKALIDSGLGSALSDGSGYDAESRDTHFTAGLKDVAADAAAEVERIVLGTLERLASGGIDRALVDAAIHQLEFHRREITNTPYPYGIRLLLGIGGTWIHGGDPLRVLKFDADLAEIRRGVERGGFFEGLVARSFLENPHRARLLLEPDTELAEREERRTAERLAAIGRELSPAEVDRLRSDAEALRRLQEAKEDPGCLPTLERSDIPPDVEKTHPSGAEPERGLEWFAQPTSGIVYLAGAAGLAGVEPGLSALVPFFCHAFTRIGTVRRDYAEMARRIDAVTGGIGLAATPRSGFDGGACIPFAALTAKCLERNAGPMIALLEELLGGYDLSDTRRLRELLVEYRAGLESQVVHNGHRLAISLASRRFSAARALSESWGGVHQLQSVKQLADDPGEDGLKRLSAELERVGRAVLGRTNLRLALIGEPGAIAASTGPVGRMVASLPAGDGPRFALAEPPSGPGRVREGWSTSTAVNFVATAFPAVRMDHEDAAALAVVAKLLRSLYLHREIREKGGAYGGFALYNAEDGVFCLASYRDPHVAATLEVFERAGEFIRGGFSETDVKEATLQVCSEIDKPEPPGPTARKAFFRRVVRLSDELREGFKQRLLALTPGTVLAAAERHVGEGLRGASVAVIGGEEALRAANASLAEPLELFRI